MRVVLFTIAIFYSLLVVGAQEKPVAQAIDCEKPISANAPDALAKAMICSFYTDEAKDLDQKMTDSLNQVYQSCSIAIAHQEQAKQKAWLTERNNLLDIELLNQAYKRRIEAVETTQAECSKMELR